MQMVWKVGLAVVTRKQQQKQWSQQRAEQKREKRKARLVRESIRKAKRKAKRVAKAAPKKGLVAWSLAVREAAYHTCEVCGATAEPKTNKDGTPKLNKKGNPITVQLNAHHLLEKRYYPEHKCNPMNGILLCPKCHSFGKFSAHKNGIWFALWLKKNNTIKYEWVKRNVGNPV